MVKTGRRYSFNLILLMLLVSTTILCACKPKQELDVSAKTQYLLLESTRLANMGNPDSTVVAYDILNRILEINPSDADALFRIAPYSYMLGKQEEFYNNILISAKSDTTNYYYNTTAANIAMELGDITTAEKIYRMLIRNNPDDEKLYDTLARTYLRMGEIEKALACYDTIEIMTDNIEYVAMTKANIYAQIKDMPKMLAELKRLSAAYPDNIEYLLPLASAYLEVDSLDKNREIINKVKALESSCLTSLSDAEYYDKMGDMDSLRISVFNALECPDIDLMTKESLIRDFLNFILKKDNDYKSLERADTLFLYLTEAYPREVSIKNFYADMLVMQSKFAEAAEQYQASLYVEPSDIDIHRRLIGVLYESGNYKQMNKAIEDAQQYVDSTFILEAASYYHFSKQTDKAKEYLQEAIDKYKSSPIFLSDLYTLMGDIYYREGDADNSFKYYNLAIKSNPVNIEALNNYAYHLSEYGGDLDKAEQMSAKTISAKPNDPTYLDTYGWIFFKKGNYLFAELYIKKSLENGGDKNSEVLEHYGDVLFKQGDIEEALKYWERALAIDKNNAKLKNKIENKTYID